MIDSSDRWTRCAGSIRSRLLWVWIGMSLGGCAGTVQRDSCECPAGQSCAADGSCVAPDAGVAAPCPAERRCGAGCCEAGQLCSARQCIAALDPSCSVESPPGLFAPVIQCRWTGPGATEPHSEHNNVLGTPTVIDFDFDEDPKTDRPSIVFVSYDGLDGSVQASNCADGFFGVIRVIDGADCSLQHTIDLVKVRASSPLALGDLDGDGRAEIVAARCGGGLVAFAYDAGAKAFKVRWSSAAAVGTSAGGWVGPAIHDLDDDGKPEIVHWLTVWDADGTLRDGTLGASSFFPAAADVDGDGAVEIASGAGWWRWSGQWGAKSGAPPAGNDAGHVAVADFGRYTKVAAHDDRSLLDGVAEIVVVSAGKVRIQTLDGRPIFGPVAIPNGGTGGPPTIGDFDNDGRAEVAAAGSDSYSVFDPDCGANADPAFCASKRKDGVLWSRVSQDHSSSVTGSSIFDFDGDGAAEAVYADECFTRIYRGSDGEVLFSQYRSSCTWHENPIVADVDGDFNAELVVPSNSNCPIDCETNPNHDKHPTTGIVLDPLFRGLRCQAGADCAGGSCDAGLCRCATDADCGAEGGFVCAPPVSGTPGSGSVCRAAYLGKVSGVIVYRDRLDRWVSSRMIWNQHTYSVTNVGDRGEIPKTSAWLANWKQPGLNNFRQNVQGSLQPSAAPDLVLTDAPPLACAGDASLELRVGLCNRGAQPVDSGVPVSFYRGDASADGAVCTAASSKKLAPGECEEVACLWEGVPTDVSLEIYAVADDDGSGAGLTTECHEDNNRTTLASVTCSLVR